MYVRAIKGSNPPLCKTYGQLFTFNVHRPLSCCGGIIYGKQTRQEMVLDDFPRIRPE